MHDSDTKGIVSKKHCLLLEAGKTRYTGNQSDQTNKSAKGQAKAMSGEGKSKSPKPRTQNTWKNAGMLDTEDKDELAQGKGSTQTKYTQVSI